MKNIYFLLFSVFFGLMGPVTYGQQKDFLLMFQGSWKFQIGDSVNWSDMDYNDSQWEYINVPSAWEDQDFNGYNGYAWYRKEFVLPKDFNEKDLYVSLGYIDDVDQVFINGKLIGFSGSFLPRFITAQDVARKYPIPMEYLNIKGKNVIAVRVYDHIMSGGIISGTIGLFEENTVQPDISLIGLWRFRSGDSIAWKEKRHNDKNWRKMVVPGNWKNHGYKDFDGSIVWYRTAIEIPDELVNQKMFFIIGRIDNCDEVYINGQLVGSTGTIVSLKKKKSQNIALKSENTITESCAKSRIYIVPDSLLLSKKKNTIAIRIYSKNSKAGIVEGPIGFIRQENLTRLARDKQSLLLND